MSMQESESSFGDPPLPPRGFWGLTTSTLFTESSPQPCPPLFCPLPGLPPSYCGVCGMELKLTFRFFTLRLAGMPFLAG